ncbi:MAG TPA: hypothetical protein VFA50_10225 [Stellaceae bacterium]|nr:hypothetical protein [Stellaceae bacterium]
MMILLVAGGTLLDIGMKKSATYFFNHWRNAQRRGVRQVGGAQMTVIALQTAAVDVLTSGEFCNAQRRAAHLLTMYGFILYIVTTIIMVFGYSTLPAPTPAVLPVLWYVGALMVSGGGYWFWFAIRVDVAAEGSSPFRLMHADLFVVSLVASTTLGFIWGILQQSGATIAADVFLALYLLATTVLFGSVPWSKFAHMFYKPAAAFQKRVEEANGSRRNLPAPADKPTIFGSGRQRPRNY